MKIRKFLGVAAALCSSAGMATSALAQSANDSCANAIAVTVDVPVATTLQSLDTADGPTNSSTSNGCTTTFFGAAQRSIWYTFTPATSGLYEVSLCGSTFDTVLAIYGATSTTTGSVAPCTGSVAALACNDDSCGTRSNFNVQLTAGQGYIIRVAQFSSGVGDVVLLVHGPQGSPAPANDDCTGAIALSLGTAVTGDITNATGSSTTLATCGSTTTTGNDVWYSFTAATAGTTNVSVCGNFDTVLSVFTAASTCAAPTNLICNDDSIPGLCGQGTHGSAVTFTAVAGSTYLIRVAGVQPTGTVSPAGSFAPTQGGFSIVVTNATGACCSSTGCTSTQSQACLQPSIWLGAGSVCSPDPCPAQRGACCASSGTCSLTVPMSCVGSTSRFQGLNSVCTPNPCTAFVGACCSTSGCTLVTAFGCASPATFGGAGSTCAVFCPTGACCVGTTCSITLATACSGTYQGTGTTCTINPCTGACCSAAGTCTLVANAGACVGTFNGSGSTCQTGICRPTTCSSSPANDPCSAAIPFIGSGFDVMGDLTCATTDPSPAISCISTKQDLWYTFVPGATGNFSIRTCAPGTASNLDTVISVHTACPTPFANNQMPTGAPGVTATCNDDSCNGGVGPSTITSITLQGGTTYWIRVALYASTSTTGAFELIVGEIVGSCCSNSTGSCNVTSQAMCPTPNAWTLGAVCSSTTCTGACCNIDGTCSALASVSGCASGASFQGLGTLCANISCPIPNGACCANDGTCAVMASNLCTSPSIFGGANSTCSGPNNTCPITVRACCSTSTGACTFQTATCASGTVETGTTCSPINPCPPVGACCSPCCTVTLQSGCSGSWTSGATCSPVPCTAPANDLPCNPVVLALGTAAIDNNCTATDTGDGAAGTGGDCDPSNHSLWYSFTPAYTASYDVNTCGSAIDTEMVIFTMTDCNDTSSFVQVACNDDSSSTTACSSGSTLASRVPAVTLAAGTTYRIRVGSFSTTTTGAIQVLVVNNNALGSCCAADGSCTQTDSANCASGTFNAGGSCSPNTCPQPTGACCATDGSCSVTTSAACSGSYQGNGSSCTPNPCPQPSGACCDVATGGCTEVVQASCTGTWTSGGTCTPNPCPQPNGACCCGSNCSITAPGACTGSGRSFAGSGTSCTPFSSTVPCCRGDFNKTGTVSVQDIFDFLAGYFSNSPCADTNDTGTISVQDIFDFLAAYFGGC